MTIGDLLPYLDNETRYFVFNEQGVIISPYNDSGPHTINKKELAPFIDLLIYKVSADPIKTGVIDIFVTKRYLISSTIMLDKSFDI